MKLDVFFRKVLYKLDMAKVFCLYCAAYACSAFFRKQKKFQHLWLIAERGVDARDNGWHLYQYIRRHDPVCNIRYVITDDSPDAEKVKSLGKTIRFGSAEHYLAVALSEALVSTHFLGYTPQDYLFQKFSRWGMMKGKKVFLQHGVFKDDMPQAHYERNQPDIFVCSVKQEADFARAVYRQPDSAVRLLGLCRFDRLPLETEQAKSRIILLMPTWRHQLFFYAPKNFRSTLYFRSWQGLLASKKLESLLEKWDYRLIFYPHHQMQKFLGQFQCASKRETVASNENYDVQELLIRSDILITDYSSVFFDYAYMRKPVIFYQFDQNEFYETNYQKGWFDYERNGGGPVAKSIGQVTEELEKLLQRDCRLEEKYLARICDLFEYRDHNNCRRNYEAIQDILGDDKEH